MCIKRGVSFSQDQSRHGYHFYKKKRKKINKNFRLQRMSELQVRIKDLSDQIGFKEKRRDQASAVHNYKQCDELSEQILSLKADKRKHEAEHKLQAKKDKKSKWYQDTVYSAVIN